MTTAIDFNDTLCATVTLRGRIINSFTLTGMTSIPAIMRTISAKIGKSVGMITVIIRNTSKGWSQKRTMTSGMNNTAKIPVGTQLSLF